MVHARARVVASLVERNACCSDPVRSPLGSGSVGQAEHFFGLFVHVLTRGRVAKSLRWVEQAMNAAETHGDPDLLIVGHHAAQTAYVQLGDHSKFREHADRVLPLYSEEPQSEDIGFALSIGGAASLVQVPGGELVDNVRAKRSLIALV
jgi:hypothetical protein